MISLSFCLRDLYAMLLLCIRHSPTEGWYQNLCYCSVYTCICVHIGSYDGLRYGPAAAGSVWQHWRRLCTTTAAAAATAIHGDAAIRRVPTACRHCTAATAAVWGNGTAGYWIRYGPWHVLYGLCMLSVQAANIEVVLVFHQAIFVKHRFEYHMYLAAFICAWWRLQDFSWNLAFLLLDSQTTSKCAFVQLVSVSFECYIL